MDVASWFYKWIRFDGWMDGCINGWMNVWMDEMAGSEKQEAPWISQNVYIYKLKCSNAKSGLGSSAKKTDLWCSFFVINDY